MSSLNKVMLIGNLGDDPEVRYTQSNTAVANMSVATTERYKDREGEYQEKTEWHRVVAWARLAEIAQEYLKKGSRLYIEGSIQTNKWEDKEGNDRYTTEIKAFSIIMLDGRGEGSDEDSSPRKKKKKKPSGNKSRGRGKSKGRGSRGKSMPDNIPDDDFDDDDDLPF